MMEWKQMEVTRSEQTFMDLQEYISREIISAYSLPQKSLGTVTDTPAWKQIRTYVTDSTFWLIHPRTYARLRYIYRVSCLCPAPTRKLRKCHLRKIVKRRQAIKRRMLTA